MTVSAPLSAPADRVREGGRPQHRGVALLLAGVLGLGLAGCSSDTASRSAAGGVADSRSVAEGAAAAPGSAPKADSPAAASTEKVVRRADTAIVVADVPKAADEIRALADTAGGSVLMESIESSQSDVSKATYATMTIQVPSDKLSDALTRLGKLGETVSRNTSADDVTATYADTEARITSMQTSVDRMRTLLSQATSVADMISIEAELSRRQADLEGLQAQMRTLKDQVNMSPISIRLTTNRVDLGSDGGGFLGGLKSGWAAFVVSIRWVLTAVGALLPFALFGGLVAAPFIWWSRRRRAARPGRSQDVRTHVPAMPSQPVPTQQMPGQPYPAGAHPGGAPTTGHLPVASSVPSPASTDPTDPPSGS